MASSSPHTQQDRLKAASNGDIDFFESLSNTDIERFRGERDEDGRTLLHSAAAGGHVRVSPRLDSHDVWLASNEMSEKSLKCIMMAAVWSDRLRSRAYVRYRLALPRQCFISLSSFLFLPPVGCGSTDERHGRLLATSECA